MAMIGPIVRNDIFFFVTILALAGMMILMEVRRRQAVVPAGRYQCRSSQSRVDGRVASACGCQPSTALRSCSLS